MVLVHGGWTAVGTLVPRGSAGGRLACGARSRSARKDQPVMPVAPSCYIRNLCSEVVQLQRLIYRLAKASKRR